MLAWLTDIHFDFLEPPRVREFLEQVRKCGADAVMLTGDVSDAPHLIARLAEMDAAIERPIYFVLGNHDFYYGSIRGVRQAVGELCRQRPNLHYLTTHRRADRIGPRLGPDRARRLGRCAARRLRAVDGDDVRLSLDRRTGAHDEVGPLAGAEGSGRRGRGSGSRKTRRKHWPDFRASGWRPILPPLREACWHEGQTSNDEWAPHFTCKAMGDVLLETMRRHPERQLTVFCGHTHSPGLAEPLPNLKIFTGGAKYGHPAVQKMLEA